jgi:hypothetical protein
VTPEAEQVFERMSAIMKRQQADYEALLAKQHAELREMILAQAREIDAHAREAWFSGLRLGLVVGMVTAVVILLIAR